MSELSKIYEEKLANIKKGGKAIGDHNKLAIHHYSNLKKKNTEKLQVLHQKYIHKEY